MLMEDSLQAEQMIPMAISLAYGIIFATVITLLLIPSLYMILDDLGAWWTARGGARRGDARRALAPGEG